MEEDNNRNIDSSNENPNNINSKNTDKKNTNPQNIDPKSVIFTRERIKDILEWVYCAIIAIVIAILIKYFIGIPTTVEMTSMYPTLEQSDKLILNRIGRTFKKMPERGDIITFEAPSNKNNKQINIENPIAIYDNEPKGWWNKFTYYVLEIKKVSYIKRVIGLPGEHVEIKEGKVYIDEKPLDEPYLDDSVKTTSDFLTDFVVPENCVFAMGDNRGGSSDCRAFGCIPLEKVESKVWIRFYPFNKFGFVK